MGIIMREKWEVRRCTMAAVRALCEAHHGYAGAGNTAVYAFGAYEGARMVAAFAWQPPPPGAARSVCPEFPAGVLALSRMVAVPKSERALNHISRPLRVIMRRMIDRTRWPALVTYSDEGQGHTGHVYKCSGWQRGRRSKRATYQDAAGRRVSSYSAGKHRSTKGLTRGTTIVQRWEHRIVTGDLWEYAQRHGWARVTVPGKVWRSGAQAYQYRRELNYA